VPGRPGTLPGVADTWHELWDRLDGLHGPVAATLPDCAALLGAELPAVEAAARHVTPYRHADGSPRWSVGELADRLGLADHDRKGRRRSWRTGDATGDPTRGHARRGAAATNGRRWPLSHAEPEPVEVEDLAAVEDLADPDAAGEVEDVPAAGEL
jgi:hypothetical protein